MNSVFIHFTMQFYKFSNKILLFNKICMSQEYVPKDFFFVHCLCATILCSIDKAILWFFFAFLGFKTFYLKNLLHCRVCCKC